MLYWRGRVNGKAMLSELVSLLREDSTFCDFLILIMLSWSVELDISLERHFGNNTKSKNLERKGLGHLA